jgi:hypothetical protein
MRTETHNLNAAEVVLTNVHRGELSQIRDGLRRIAAGTVILQIAENSLYVVSGNLAQMKLLLAEAVLSDRYDDEGKDKIVSEFSELAEQNKQIADSTTCNEYTLHCDDQMIELFAEGQLTIVWMTQRVPAVDTDLLARPEEVCQTLQNAIDNVNAYCSGIRSLLATLRRHAESLHSKSETILKSTAPVSRISTANTITYRVAAQILQANHSAIASHSNQIKIIAGSLIG